MASLEGMGSIIGTTERNIVLMWVFYFCMYAGNNGRTLNLERKWCLVDKMGCPEPRLDALM